MVTAPSDDLESLEQFVAREGAYPEPAPDRSRYQWIDAGLRARRAIGDIQQWTTNEESATGPALAEWFVKLLDLWVSADALPERQATVIRLRFLDEHPCEGSGRFVGVGQPIARCTHCPEPKRYDNPEQFHHYRVDRTGRLVPHTREWTIDDVARAMHLSNRTVREALRAAMTTIETNIWPPRPAEDAHLGGAE